MKYKKNPFLYFGYVAMFVGTIVYLLTFMTPVSAATSQVPPLTNSSSKACNGVPLGIKINNTNCLANGNTDATNPLLVYAKIVLKVLSVGVGIAVVGGIVWGGIKYTTARGNSSQTQDAISTITNSVIGLLLYIFMFAFLNFLIPGGIFG